MTYSIKCNACYAFMLHLNAISELRCFSPVCSRWHCYCCLRPPWRSHPRPASGRQCRPSCCCCCQTALCCLAVAFVASIDFFASSSRRSRRSRFNVNVAIYIKCATAAAVSTTAASEAAATAAESETRLVGHEINSRRVPHCQRGLASLWNRQNRERYKSVKMYDAANAIY